MSRLLTEISFISNRSDLNLLLRAEFKAPQHTQTTVEVVALEVARPRSSTVVVVVVVVVVTPSIIKY